MDVTELWTGERLPSGAVEWVLEKLRALDPDTLAWLFLLCAEETVPLPYPVAQVLVARHLIRAASFTPFAAVRAVTIAACKALPGGAIAIESPYATEGAWQ